VRAWPALLANTGETRRKRLQRPGDCVPKTSILAAPLGTR